LDFNTTAVPQFDQRTLILKYDAANRTTLITDDEGPEYGYAYDQFDNATSETSKDGSVVNSIVTYSYDKAGRRKSFRARVPGTSSDTGTLSYQYSDADELLTILKNGVPLADLNYDPDGHRESLHVHLQGEVETDYGYDQASRLSSLTYTAKNLPLGDLGYLYDPDGQMKQMTGSLAAVSLSNVPLLSLAVYGPANELQKWNGKPSDINKNNSLNFDPANGETYSWDARAQVDAITKSTTLATTYQY